MKKLLLLAVLIVCSGSVIGAPDETFETLTVGTNAYSKVTVLNKTRNDLFVSHSKGMANIKVKDLDPATQLKLGYQIEQPKPTKIEQVLEATRMANLESDSRIQEFEEMIAPEMNQAAEFIEHMDERTGQLIIGGIISVYLVFSFLCRCICVKTGNPPSLFIWLPFVKLIPLFKAAGMSGWWILTCVLPGISLITYLVWCFKIVHARGKHVLFAIMLLLPVTNIVAFLYLALSGDGSSGAKSKRNVISLSGASLREAA